MQAESTRSATVSFSSWEKEKLEREKKLVLPRLFVKKKKKRYRWEHCISHATGNVFVKMHTEPAMHYGLPSAQKLLFLPPHMEKKWKIYQVKMQSHKLLLLSVKVPDVFFILSQTVSYKEMKLCSVQTFVFQWRYIFRTEKGLKSTWKWNQTRLW